ncbi:GIY-YIG nuclease family protein [Nocardia sp. CDC159]|uniref:GIY-YIG nuclease family protein n=1 Tax=Nocardia pulmonis TaxID=2951408 RepID=A0A9X2IUK2_9NOCA|nr:MULTISPECIES: GIY-YIG nuclease family protein [Nocardia]MCM6772208.1 GIY-YIG nuclease family protein [Nocardia pulmonis]MCM6785134.1 GIY-YIG nuclease family protein [Nocardia sp. CDC159]
MGRSYRHVPCTYILASAPHGMLYVGATVNLVGRVWQHRNDVVPSHTSRHGIHTLVWYEAQATLENALLRERHLKQWRRARKIALIEETNPDWLDLYSSLL